MRGRTGEWWLLAVTLLVLAPACGQPDHLQIANSSSPGAELASPPPRLSTPVATQRRDDCGLTITGDYALIPSLSHLAWMSEQVVVATVEGQVDPIWWDDRI